MKKIYQNLILFFLALIMQGQVYSQVNCFDMVYISLNPWDGTADLEADWFVEGGDQYDELSIDVSQVDCDDIGTPVDVIITAELDGITSTCTSLAIVEDKSPPVVVVIQNLEVLLDDNGEASITADDIDNGSWDNCGPITLSVSPSQFNCSDIGQDPVVTLTAEDESGNWNTAFVNVIVIQGPSAIACNDEIFVNIDNGPLLVSTDMVLEGNIGSCDENYEISIVDANGEAVPDNIVWSTYAGSTLAYTVVNSYGNECWGSIIVDGEIDCDPFFICDTECRSTPVGDCDSGHTLDDNVEWPCHISISILGIDNDSLSPANLITFFGVDPMDAMPTIQNYDCNTLGISYNDDIFIVDNFSYKVLRTWTIIDWLTSDDYQYVQVIDNFPATDYICDILPRTAPEGDCDSGHTLDDDAEWPADLNIEDYHITPEELITFSGVDPLDSEPSFYNEPDMYSSTYVDYLVELLPEELTIGREWTVSRSDAPGTYWVYTQTIVVNLGAFANLVTVETMTARPVPDVQVNSTTLTDENGNATVEPTDVVNPWLTDDPKNGLDIVDLFIMRQHILGINAMNEYQIITGDVNENEAVTTLDLVLVERVILGIEDQISSNWWFVDKPADDNLSPRAQYIALKPGDVNDSATLGANSFTGEGDIKYQDQIVNEGEIIKVPFFVTEEMLSYGMELSFTIDNAILEVEEILSPYFANSVTYSQNANGELNIVIMEKLSGELQEITTDQALFQITFKALENTVISWSLNLNENRSSFSIDENQELVLFGEVIDGEIISGLNDLEELEGVSVYPNPASDIINIEASSKTLSEDFTVNILNSSGQLINSTKGAKQINVTNLSPGMYYYTIVQADKLAKGKIVIAR